MCVVWTLLSPHVLYLHCHIHHSNPGLLPSLCPSSVMSVMTHLFSSPPSINKLFLASYHLSGLCSLFFSRLYLLSFSTATPVISASLTPFSPSGPCILPRPHYVRYSSQLAPPGLSSAFELSYLLPFPRLPSASFCAQPLRCKCNCESERKPCWILNPEPRQTFLPRQNLFISQSPPSRSAAGCSCPPHLVPRSRLIVLTTAAWRGGKWQLHFAMCYSHAHTIKLIPLQITSLLQNSLPVGCFSPRFHIWWPMWASLWMTFCLLKTLIHHAVTSNCWSLPKTVL